MTDNVVSKGFEKCLDVILDGRKLIYHLSDKEVAQMRKEILDDTYKYDANEKYKDRF